MTPEDGSIRIGELLVRAGVITAADLSEAEKLSAHMKVQFGRLLIMAGCLTEEALDCALEAQALIRQGLLTFDIAIEAVGFAVEEKMSLRQALELLDVLPQYGTATLKLAELIQEAQIIAEEKLAKALEHSVKTNISLGDVLVSEKCIPATLLPILVQYQEQIRTNSLKRGEAIAELQGAFYVWQRADHSSSSQPQSPGAIPQELATAGDTSQYRAATAASGPESRNNSGQGQSSSDEVFIYSDGYFAEHERPTFDDIPQFMPISNDDEQRINDLLDTFAENAATDFSADSASQPELWEVPVAVAAGNNASVNQSSGSPMGLPLPADTITRLKALAFGVPTTSLPQSTTANPAAHTTAPAPPSSAPHKEPDWKPVDPSPPLPQMSGQSHSQAAVAFAGPPHPPGSEQSGAHTPAATRQANQTTSIFDQLDFGPPAAEPAQSGGLDDKQASAVGPDTNGGPQVKDLDRSLFPQSDTATEVEIAPYTIEPVTAGEVAVVEARTAETAKTRSLTEQRKKKKKTSPAGAELERADLINLLQDAGFFAASDLDLFFHRALEDPIRAGELLKILGVVDKSVLDAASRLLKLTLQGKLDSQRARQQLKSIREGKLKPTDLNAELALKKSKRHE